jgi:murein L,D-transpeptidase YcbB/YkuD
MGVLNHRRRLAFLLVALACVVVAARRTRPLVLSAAPPRSDVQTASVRPLIAAIVAGRDPILGVVSPDERVALEALYQGGGPLWISSEGEPSRNMKDALTILAHAADEGLEPADYYPEIVTRETVHRPRAAVASPQEIARIDVAVSAAMVRYLRDEHLGRTDPRAIGFLLDVPRDRHDFAALLSAAMASQRVPALATDLRPPLAQYRLLRSWLTRYRALAMDSAFIAVPPAARAVHPGDAYASVDVLRQELAALGDFAADAPCRDEGRYDGPTVDAVKRFQQRHGLRADGVLGASTIAALRVPLTWRVRQIELALERLRWVPHVGEERLIALNIPMFRLWAWDAIPPDGTPRFGMDAIVGRALRTQTPVFAAEMDEVIFRPYWNVPRSILVHEVLPMLERSGSIRGYEDFEVVRESGDGSPIVAPLPQLLAGLRRGDFRLRQRPGPQNALGLIKFAFPNRADVYMHGTPAQALFAQNRRDFSHGCVRVADPVALAEWVLHDRPEWSRDRIVAATMGAETLHVKLPRPIQVILFYTTATGMPEDGTIHFADDIYRHDARLEQALTTVHHIRTRPVSTWTKSDAG